MMPELYEERALQCLRLMRGCTDLAALEALEKLADKYAKIAAALRRKEVEMRPAGTSLFAGTPTIVELPSGPTNHSLKDLHAYWLSKKGAHFAPPRSAIAPEEIPVSLLPHIGLLDVIGDPPLFRVRLFGTALVQAYGEDPTGRFLDEMDLGSIAADLQARFIEVVRECRPQTIRVQLSKQTETRYLDYERIALPLSQDGVRVNMILCGFAVVRMWH